MTRTMTPGSIDQEKTITIRCGVLRDDGRRARRSVRAYDLNYYQPAAPELRAAEAHAEGACGSIYNLR